MLVLFQASFIFLSMMNPTLRRSPRLAAKNVSVPVPVPVPAQPVCTMAAHEASCAWCRVHPEWRKIKGNLTLMLTPYVGDAINGRAARAASALAMMSYINDVGIGFALAHKKFCDVVIDRCRHCIENGGEEYPLLRMICSDLLRKLTV